MNGIKEDISGFAASKSDNVTGLQIYMGGYSFNQTITATQGILEGYITLRER